jgi:hypothetical protein
VLFVFYAALAIRGTMPGHQTTINNEVPTAYDDVAFRSDPTHALGVLFAHSGTFLDHKRL